MVPRSAVLPLAALHPLAGLPLAGLPLAVPPLAELPLAVPPLAVPLLAVPLLAVPLLAVPLLAGLPLAVLLLAMFLLHHHLEVLPNSGMPLLQQPVSGQAYPPEHRRYSCKSHFPVLDHSPHGDR